MAPKLTILAGLVWLWRGDGRIWNIAQATLEDGLDVLPRLQQVMDQNVTLRFVAVEERTNCQHSWSGRFGSSQHGTSEMRWRRVGLTGQGSMKENWLVVAVVVLLYGSPGPRFPRPNPKRGRKDRSRQNTTQDAFVCIGSRPKRFETVPTVVYPCLSSSSDDHHLSHSCLGTGMRFGTQNKFCHYRASLVHLVSLIVS